MEYLAADRNHQIDDVDRKEYWAMQKIPFPEWDFRYAVWGVGTQPAHDFCKLMKKYMPNGRLIAGIDIVDGENDCGCHIIKPKDIYEIPEDVIIIITDPFVQESAKRILMELERPFVLLKGAEVEYYNF